MTVVSLPAREWSLEDAIERYFQSDFSDGDLVSHDWLAWALAFPEPKDVAEMREAQFAILERVESFKEALLVNHQIALQSVRGQGYRVVPPSEQARYAALEASRHIQKGLRRGDKLLSHTRMDALSDTQRRRHVDAEARMAALGELVTRGKRDIFRLFKPS